MSQYGSYGCLTEYQASQMGFCLGDVVHFICENHDDLERVADTFACGDLDEAFKMILADGLQRYLDLCDIDDELNADDHKEAKR